MKGTIWNHMENVGLKLLRIITPYCIREASHSSNTYHPSIHIDPFLFLNFPSVTDLFTWIPHASGSSSMGGADSAVWRKASAQQARCHSGNSQLRLVQLIVSILLGFRVYPRHTSQNKRCLRNATDISNK